MHYWLMAYATLLVPLQLRQPVAVPNLLEINLKYLCK